MEKYLGELAAIGTSFCWSFGSIFFTIASRLIGSTEVNRVRLVLGMLFLAGTHFIMYGMFFPLKSTAYHWFWFGISGVIGFTIGDTLLFRGYVLIGPRLTMLLMSLAPIFGAILAWVFLDESLKFIEILAILITISGIVIVINDKKEGAGDGKVFSSGIIYGIGAAFCQALGYFASKKGLMYNEFSALSGNLIRIMFGSFFIWLIALLQKEARNTIGKLKNKRADIAILGGAVFGPFIGVWFSLIAIQHTYVGIASTLMALPPVILIPLSNWIFKEKITYLAIIGTIISVFGVALIFLT